MASFEKNKNSKWSVRFRCIENGIEKYKRLSSFDTKKEANNAYIKFMNELVPSKAIEKKTITLNQLYDIYYDNIKQRLKVSSLYENKQIYNNLIEPYFGDKNIYKITKLDILKWQNILNEKNYCYTYKSKIRGNLSAIFNFAVNYYDLEFNPISRVESFRNVEKKKDMLFWSKKEFKSFISCVDDFSYNVFFSFLYFSGCRKGEALALSWSDIDFINNKVSITKSLTRKVKDKVYEIVSPKNHSSNRIIMLPKKLIDDLKSLSINQKEKIFVFGDAEPLKEMTISRRLKYYCDKANVKVIRVHDFRHSHASLLIENGENILLIAKRLGHSNIEQTLNTYSHLMPDAESEMIKKLDLEDA